MHSESILIVEDDPTNALILEQFVKKLGYNVNAVIATGEESIARINELQPNLVLMDINLAGAIDGIVAASTIHQLSNIPVIYITATMGDATMDRVKTSGARGFIQKPVRLFDLQIQIELALYSARLEQRLRASEEKHRSMFEQAVIGMFTLTADGHVSDVNKAFATMLGYASQREARQYVQRIDALFYEEKDADVFRESLAQGELHNFEAPVLGKDGNVVWASIHLQSLNNSNEAGIRFEGSMLDITARREAEELSARYMELLKRTINSMTSQIAVLDLDRNIILINDALAQIASISPEEAVGKQCHEVSPGNFCLQDCCPMTELLKDGCAHKRETVDLRTGKRCLTSVSPFYDQSNELIGCVHVVSEFPQTPTQTINGNDELPSAPKIS